MPKVFKLLLIALYCLFILFIGGLICIVGAVIHFGKDLPDYRQLDEYDPPYITRVYSKDADLIGEYAYERRIYAEYNKIPKLVINAFLSAEDKNYFKHAGIDFYGILRAAIYNIMSTTTGKTQAGGSTITQQVVKNFLLTNEKTISRKIKEAIISYRISRVYSKERVLELYLNQIFLGNNAYGIAEASFAYFSKDLSELNIQEAAILAALPKAPSQINPIKHQQRAMERRNWVIGRMIEDGFITQEEGERAINSPIKLSPHKSLIPQYSEHYSDAVRRNLLEIFDESSIYNNGYTVITNIDMELQKAAAVALNNGVKQYDRKHGYRGRLGHLGSNIKELNWLDELTKYAANHTNIDKRHIAVVLSTSNDSLDIGLYDGSIAKIETKGFEWIIKSNIIIKPLNNIGKIIKVGDLILVTQVDNSYYEIDQEPIVNGAIVAVEVTTGKVLSLIGGYGTSNGHNFNRATMALRQPGSLIKPFVYLKAFESGYKPNDIIIDSPLSMSQGPGLKAWQPKNYSNTFLGPMTIRSALEKSQNIPSIKLASQVGISNLIELFKRLGIYEDVQRNMSIVLGAQETTVMRIANAYNTLANYGIKTDLKLIDRVYNNKGKLIYKNDDFILQDDINFDIKPFYIRQHTESIVNERHAYQLIHVLEGVVERGTGRAALALGKPVAGKTGTTNESKEAWSILFTPDIMTVVYIGFDSPDTLGARETGATLAMPIAVNFMKQALAGRPAKQFRVPDGVKLLPINRQTGVITEQTQDSSTIYEAFIENEPNKDPSVTTSLEDEMDHEDSAVHTKEEIILEETLIDEEEL